jgi:hypothetical protein
MENAYLEQILETCGVYMYFFNIECYDSIVTEVCPAITHILSFSELYPAGCRSGNGQNSYSQSTPFESSLWHRLTWLFFSYGF